VISVLGIDPGRITGNPQLKNPLGPKAGIRTSGVFIVAVRGSSRIVGNSETIQKRASRK
jgi:hypothetical protein